MKQDYPSARQEGIRGGECKRCVFLNSTPEGSSVPFTSGRQLYQAGKRPYYVPDWWEHGWVPAEVSTF